MKSAARHCADGMELLAPAGNFDSLKAAVICGADAVYLGAEKFGARASADNFDESSLARAVEFAHLHGVKIHLTVNTLIKDSEMPDAIATVKKAHSMGVDAFIVQDLGLIHRIKEEVPYAVLHASTQMGISNLYGAMLAQSLGIRRVVLARETLPSDIAEIKHKTNLEVEVFCHGALCVSYSGNCYYSSLVSGCSGNRGKCLQLCRKKYISEGSSGYFLSAKDICLVDKIAELKALGVDSLKIEGRMRAPEYVAETVSVYKKAIEGKAPANTMERLKTVFNRGNFCKAYFVEPTEKVIYSQTQNNIGLKCGKVKAIRQGKAILETSRKLSLGDGVKYLRNGIETGGGLIDGQGETGFRGSVKTGDDVHLTSSVKLKKKVSSLCADIPVKVDVNIGMNGASVTASYNGFAGVAKSDIAVQRAQSRALRKEEVANAIGTLGGTDFSLESINITLEDNVFFPASQIKTLRKTAVVGLKNKILTDYNAKQKGIANSAICERKTDWLKIADDTKFVQVSSAAQAEKIGFHYDYVILSPANYNDYESIRNECVKIGENVILNLPFIVRGKDIDVLKKLRDLPVKAFVANNIAHFVIFEGKVFVGGIGLNKLNSEINGTFMDSIEREERGSGITYAYGKPPLMHFAHCPRKSRGNGCSDCNGYTYTIKDDKGATMEYRRIKENYCYSVLIPSVPVNNIELCKSGKILYDFSYSTDEEINAVNAQIAGGGYRLAHTHANFGKTLQ